MHPHPTVLALVASQAVNVVPAEREVEIATPALPGVTKITIQTKPILAVVAVGEQRLKHPIPFTPAAPLWTPAPKGLQPEPRWDVGAEVIALVDTEKFPWRMTCKCGRIRFAKANSRHQVQACRVCTAKGRRARRNCAQREAREMRKT